MQMGLIGQGLELMLFGMGTVMLFLVLLVVVMTCMSKVVERYFAEADMLPLPVQAKTVQMSTDVPANTVNPETIAAISAAIHCYRNKR